MKATNLIIQLCRIVRDNNHDIDVTILDKMRVTDEGVTEVMRDVKRVRYNADAGGDGIMLS